MNMLRRLLFAVLIMSVATPVLAQRYQLDDSLSPRQIYSLTLEWQPVEMGRAIQAMFADEPSRLPPLSGTLRSVDVRLNAGEFVGQRVRIFLSLPPAIAGLQGPGSMQLTWRTQGQLHAGSVRPGQEAMIFEGVVERPIISDIFDFSLSVDAGDVTDSFVFEPEYELEVIS